MPLGLNAETKTLLAAGGFETAWLVELGGTPPVRYATGDRTLFYSGNYTPGILDSVAFDESASVRRLLQLNLLDSGRTLLAALVAAGVSGRTVTARLGVINYVRSSVPVPILTYRGYGDKLEPNQENGMLVYQFTSIYSKIDSQPTNSTSKQFARAISGTINPDTCCDFSHLSRELKWHKN